MSEKYGVVERTDRADKPVRLHIGSYGYVDMSAAAAEEWARQLLHAAHPREHAFIIPIPTGTEETTD